ncbi:hypothetical protein CTAM01_16572 [Colletotrichum tamarilloi]|uniref:C2H2-type domain-containing protein n=2 Tax=Colletotrichum acutatum species complex TaxID=2707335 RepID=A0A9P9XSL1_9PEZI|nr:uncharacterized protein CTAM01_16572 [Colletotrichum tamarilloi]KAI3558868.1 hypothetical protein CABS02_00908 [Colletotrichum abscissum]KAK1471355.1 hypothetical protein CTAM01_16572 [Colletotrichum tamarilloi]
MNFACVTCLQTWPSWRSRDQHVAAKSHLAPEFECDTCDRYCNNQRAIEQHMTALNHWADSSSDEPEYYCDYDSCSEVLDDEDALREHEVNEHFYCDPCDRTFQDSNSIKMHRNSRAHRGNNASCLFCHKSYVTAAGIFHHLEEGACEKAPLTRLGVFQAAKQRDPNGVLTKRLQEWAVEVTLEATTESWDPVTKTFNCSLCSGRFASLESLNQHLKSPKHQQSLYHCPKHGCSREFSTLAAVTEHLQSESCNFMAFEAVQEFAARIFDPGRMITL